MENDFDDVREPTGANNWLDDQDYTELLELVAVARGEEVARMVMSERDSGSPTTRLVNLTALEHKLIVLKAKA